MRVDFSFLVNNFLQPKRLFDFIVYLIVFFGLSLLAIVFGGLTRNESRDLFLMNIPEFVEAAMVLNRETLVAFVVIGALWMFVLDVLKSILSRTCMYAVPVPKYQWLRWNVWLLAVNCGVSAVFFILDMSLFALPVLLGACFTVGEAMRRCLDLFEGPKGHFLAITLPALVLPYLSSVALSMPAFVMVVSVAVSVLIPYVLADTSYRTWRARFISDKNGIAGYINIKADGSHLKWSRFDKKKRIVSFPNSANSYKQTIFNMSFPFSGLTTWDRGAPLKLIGLRIFAGLAPATLVMLFSDAVYDSQSIIYVILPVVFIGVGSSVSGSLVMHYQILGRSESGKSLSSIYWKQGVSLAVSMFIVLVVFNIALAEVLSWVALWVIALKALFILVTAPLALAVFIEKRQKPRRMLNIRPMLLMIGWCLPLTFFGKWAEMTSNQVSGTYMNNMLGVSLVIVVLLVLSPYLLNKYMKRYFRIQHLIRR